MIECDSLRLASGQRRSISEFRTRMARLTKYCEFDRWAAAAAATRAARLVTWISAGLVGFGRLE